jgi:hypothetical protein
MAKTSYWGPVERTIEQALHEWTTQNGSRDSESSLAAFIAHSLREAGLINAQEELSRTFIPKEHLRTPPTTTAPKPGPPGKSAQPKPAPSAVSAPSPRPKPGPRPAPAPKPQPPKK